MTTVTTEAMVTVREAATPLRRSERTIRRLCERGEIPAVKLGNAWLLYPSWLAAFTAWPPGDTP